MTEKGLQMHLTAQFQTFPDRKQGICPQQTVLPTTLNIQFVEGKHTTYRGKTDALPSKKERTNLKREYPRSISTVNISIHNWLSTKYRKSLARMETNRPPVGKKRFSANRKYKVSKRQSPRRRKMRKKPAEKKGKSRKSEKKIVNLQPYETNIPSNKQR